MTILSRASTIFWMSDTTTLSSLNTQIPETALFSFCLFDRKVVENLCGMFWERYGRTFDPSCCAVCGLRFSHVTGDMCGFVRERSPLFGRNDIHFKIYLLLHECKALYSFYSLLYVLCS